MLNGARKNLSNLSLSFVIYLRDTTLAIVKDLLRLLSGFAGYMTNTNGSLKGIGKIFLFEPEGHVDQADQNRNFHQWSDNPVLDQRKGQHFIIAKYLPELFVFNLGQGGYIIRIKPMAMVCWWSQAGNN
jgi:hypothetical protein